MPAILQRSAITLRVPSHPHLAPTIANDVRKRPVDSVSRPWVSLPVPPRPVRLGVGRRESGAKPLRAGQSRIGQIHRVGGAPHIADIAPQPVVVLAIAAQGHGTQNWKTSPRAQEQIRIGSSLRLSQKL